MKRENKGREKGLKYRLHKFHIYFQVRRSVTFEGAKLNRQEQVEEKVLKNISLASTILYRLVCKSATIEF